MEKTSEIFTNKTQETFHQGFAKIFSFLDFTSLMTSLTVSQDFYLLLNNYFKRFLLTNYKVNDFEGDENYYRRLFRSLFAREVLMAPLSASTQSYKDLNLTRHTGYLTCGVKDFSMGPKFTVFHLYNNDLAFINNQEYLETQFNMNNIDPKNVKKSVMKFSTAANELFYLSASGHLHVIFASTGLPSKEFAERVLEITTKNTLIDFTVSYPRAILQLKDNCGENSIKCFDMTNLVPEDLNSPARLRDIEGLENQTIISFCAGFSQGYFLTNEGKVFECNFNLVQNDKYKVTPFEHFKNSTIRKLWCGKGTFFALEQNERLSIDNWTQKEILEWVNQNKDFDEYMNIVKSENVTGKELISADRAFLIERLGLEKQDLQTKFLNEIEKVSQKTYAASKLYGWGNNSSGQLGLNGVQTNVSSPVEIKTLPELGKNDYIEHIECGTKATAIVTHSGRVWITELPSRDKTAIRWLDLTPNCQPVKGKRRNQVVKVSLNKDYIAVLIANVGQKKTVKKAENDEQPISTKLKGADHICNRLLWDKSLNKDEYVVGYEDRFLGILEIPFNDFCTKSDIPSHRIKFFKRRGEVVWDRVAKKNSIGL